MLPSPRGRAAPTTERRCARHGRRETAMAGVVWALMGVVAALAVTVAAALAWFSRSIQRLEARLGAPRAAADAARVDPVHQHEQERRERAPAGLRAEVDQANATVEQTRASFSAARTDVATAQAEANAARAEARRVLDAAQAEAEALLERTHRQAEQLKAAGRRSGEREIALLTAAAREHAVEIERRQRRLDERERRLAEEADRLAEREKQIRAVEAELAAQGTALAEQQAALVEAEELRLKELERIAGLTAEAARAELVAAIETQAKREAAVLVRDLEAEARRTGEQRARHIVVDAIQRVASEQTAESVVSVLHLPSDEMKGRII